MVHEIYWRVSNQCSYAIPVWRNRLFKAVTSFGESLCMTHQIEQNCVSHWVYVSDICLYSLNFCFLSLFMRVCVCLLWQWHLGMFADQYLPTWRGFESHYGYYQGCEDYYDHTYEAVEVMSPQLFFILIAFSVIRKPYQFTHLYDFLWLWLSCFWKIWITKSRCFYYQVVQLLPIYGQLWISVLSFCYISIFHFIFGPRSSTLSFLKSLICFCNAGCSFPFLINVWKSEMVLRCAFYMVTRMYDILMRLCVLKAFSAVFFALLRK